MFSFINLIVSGSTEDDYLLTCHKMIIHNSTKPSQRRLQKFKGSERSLTSQALILTKICDDRRIKFKGFSARVLRGEHEHISFYRVCIVLVSVIVALTMLIILPHIIFSFFCGLPSDTWKKWERAKYLAVADCCKLRMGLCPRSISTAVSQKLHESEGHIQCHVGHIDRLEVSFLETLIVFLWQLW